jgi:hypothetical protein
LLAALEFRCDRRISELLHFAVIPVKTLEKREDVASKKARNHF